MKANKSPEKIYLQEPTKVRTEKKYDNDVEYTRTDYFIEKACKFLQDRIEHDSIDYPMATHWLIEDFRNYMKGE